MDEQAIKHSCAVKMWTTNNVHKNSCQPDWCWIGHVRQYEVIGRIHKNILKWKLVVGKRNFGLLQLRYWDVASITWRSWLLTWKTGKNCHGCSRWKSNLITCKLVFKVSKKPIITPFEIRLNPFFRLKWNFKSCNYFKIINDNVPNGLDTL